MLAHVFPVFCILITSTCAIRIARVMPTPSNNPALTHRHDAYVNQKVYNDPHNILNHDAWYLRHAQVNQTLIDPLVPANETRVIEVFGTPAPGSRNNTQGFATSASSLKASATIKAAASSTTGASRIIDSVKAIGMTEALGAVDTNKGNWDEETNEACVAALQASQAASASTSGMAACYNVKSLNGTTGSFEAEVRLYQVSQPSAQWDQGQSEGLNLGLNYARSTVTGKTARQEQREIVDERPKKASEMEKESLNARSPRLRPRQLETLELEGQVDNDALSELENMQVALLILSPKIMLSIMSSGRPLVSTALSLQDGSFVNGLFTNATATKETTKEPAGTDKGSTWAYISATNTLATLPTGLILTSLWILAVSIVWYSELLVRMRIRNRYRQAVKQDRACGPSIINWN